MLTSSDINRGLQLFIQHRDKAFFPKKITTVNELPLLDSGKLDRKALSGLVDSVGEKA